MAEKFSAEDLRNRVASFIAPIDQRELAIRMVETGLGLKRPPGKSAAALIDEMPYGPDDIDWMKAAEAALLYFRECIAHGQLTS